MAKKKKYGNPNKQKAYEANKRQEQKENGLEKMKQFCLENDINFDRMLAVTMITGMNGRALAKTDINETGDHRIVGDEGTINSDKWTPMVLSDGGFLAYDGPIPDGTVPTAEMTEPKMIKFEGDPAAINIQMSMYLLTNFLWKSFVKLGDNPGVYEKLVRHAETFDDFSKGMDDAFQLGMIKVENKTHNKKVRIILSTRTTA